MLSPIEYEAGEMTTACGGRAGSDDAGAERAERAPDPIDPPFTGEGADWGRGAGLEFDFGAGRLACASDVDAAGGVVATEGFV